MFQGGTGINASLAKAGQYNSVQFAEKKSDEQQLIPPQGAMAGGSDGGVYGTGGDPNAVASAVQSGDSDL